MINRDTFVERYEEIVIKLNEIKASRGLVDDRIDECQSLMVDVDMLFEVIASVEGINVDKFIAMLKTLKKEIGTEIAILNQMAKLVDNYGL